MLARLNILTLGVRNLPKVRAFYEALGWESRSEGDEFARFQTGGATLAFFSLDLLAGEANMQPSESIGGFPGFTCAVLVDAEAMVDEAIERVHEARGRVLAEPVAREWGGRSGYLADPEGNAWELAWMPGANIIPVLGRRKLRDLSRDDVRRLYRIKRDEGLSNRSLEYIHVTLHRALKDARNDHKINGNPTDGVRPHKTPEGAAKESKALDPSQVAALLSAASGSRSEALYVVAIHAGLRRGEVLGLRWSDVDLERGTLSVRRSLDVDGTLKTPKNPASRRTLKLTPAR